MAEPTDDERWFEVLTGRAEASEDPEAAALRKSILAREQRDEADTQSDQLALRRLMARLEKEELLEAKPVAPSRTRWYALAASVVLAALLVPAVIQMTPDSLDGTDPGEVWRGIVEPQELTVADPEAISAELENDLTALGISVQRYEYEGRWIVDAETTPAERDAVAPLLDALGATLPYDGRVLLAFAVP